jgi:hypothetical protein
MREIKCIYCQNLNPSQNNFCEHCGRPLNKHTINQSEEHTLNKSKYRFGHIMWLITKLVIMIFFIAYAITEQDFPTKLSALFIGIIPLVSFFEEFVLFRKHIKENKRVIVTPSRILIVVFVALMGVGLSIQYLEPYIDFEGDFSFEEIYEEVYEYEIEPGYEYIEPVALEDMQARIENVILNSTSSYEYLILEEMDDQYIVDVDITDINNVDDAVNLFVELVENMYDSESVYLYIRDFKVHYYYEGEHLYSARLYNLFLKDVILIETDATFYESRSNISTLMVKIIYEGFTFDGKEVDYDQTTTESEQAYFDEYDIWYGNFDILMSDLYDDFTLLSDDYLEDGIEPTDDEIENLEFLSNQLQNKCEAFDEIVPDENYVVFHQYVSRGCHFYLKGYTIAIDGFRNKSSDRVDYAYIDLNLGYYYFEILWGDEEDEIGSEV